MNKSKSLDIEDERIVTEHTRGSYFLSEKEIEHFLAFVGFGNLKKSNIIFLGNEEGLGGYELGNVIKARCEVFGQHSETYLNENNCLDGFYEIPENVEDKYDNVMEQIRGSLKSRKELFSPILEFQARVVLHIQDPNKNWFQKKEENLENYQIIKEYYQTSLYKNTSSFPVSLMDLRPFPRRNERDEWPFQNIDRLQYLKAFSFDQNAKLDDLYFELRDKRASILKRAIELSEVKYIIGIGDKEAKKNFFEQYFTTEKFKGHKLGKNKVVLYETKIISNGKEVKVLLCDFFDYRNLSLVGLENLVKNHIFL